MVTVAGLYGCTRSGDVTPKQTSSTLITGQWFYTTDSLKTYNNGTLQLVSVKQYAHTDYVQFSADGTGTEYVSSSGSKLAFNYQVSGSTVVLNYPSQTILGSTTQAYTETAAIKQLTGTAMELYFDNTTVNNGVTTRNTEAAYFTK